MYITIEDKILPDSIAHFSGEKDNFNSVIIFMHILDVNLNEVSLCLHICYIMVLVIFLLGNHIH